MKELHVTAVWESVQTVEVDDDWDGAYGVVADQLDSGLVRLADWMVDDDDPPEIVR